MSDIQELIHKTSMDCIDKGKRLEQERIIKLLEDSRERTNQRIQNDGLTGVDLAERIGVYKTLGNAIALIKGEK